MIYESIFKIILLYFLYLIINFLKKESSVLRKTSHQLQQQFPTNLSLYLPTVFLLDGSNTSDPDRMISGYFCTKISDTASFNIIQPTLSIKRSLKKSGLYPILFLSLISCTAISYRIFKQPSGANASVPALRLAWRSSSPKSPLSSQVCQVEVVYSELH